MKIQTWLEGEDSSKARDIIVENNNEPTAVIDSFIPNIINYVRVLVFNGAHDGPPSQIIELDMPEGSKFIIFIFFLPSKSLYNDNFMHECFFF